MAELELVTDRQIYERVLGAIPQARELVWIATADIKDMYVHHGRHMVPFLQILSELVAGGVAVRILHAKEPGPRFRRDFDRYPNLIEGLERVLCPRVHLKAVVVDGTWAYSGSANLTGAGMGAKSDRRRNFESGFVTSDEGLVARIMDQLDAIWMGRYCSPCERKQYCPSVQDMLERLTPLNQSVETDRVGH